METPEKTMEPGLIGYMNSGAETRLENRTDAQHAQHFGIEALTSLLEASLDGILIVDDNRRYVYANPTACRILGYSLEEMVDRDFLMNFPEREHAAMLLNFEDSLDGRPGRWTT